MPEQIDVSDRPADALAGRVHRRLRAAEGAPRRVQVELPVELTAALRWLRAQPFLPKSYWQGRTGEEAVATVGAADVWEASHLYALSGLDDCLATAGPGVRYYGGACFDSAVPLGDEWRSFGGVRFVLPRFELRTGGGRSRLLCNLVLPRDADRAADVLAEVGALASPHPAAWGALPPRKGRTDRPERAGWSQGVEQALAAFREGALEKVVLARRTDFSFAASLDPLGLFARLHAATSGCFHFFFQPEGGAAFVGATPEQLFRFGGGRVWSEAVAGTRPRGATPSDDERLCSELMESRKEQREHALVVTSIRERLEALCRSVDAEGAPQVLRLERGQHLRLRMQGALRRDVSAVDVLRALHPTPAVEGTPPEAARRAIRRWEPFDRGWYAGPVGWIGKDRADIAVGIRSGLVHGGTLSLFSGAGIVEGSQPEREWMEIEQKIGNFVEGLGL